MCSCCSQSIDFLWLLSCQLDRLKNNNMAEEGLRVTLNVIWWLTGHWYCIGTSDWWMQDSSFMLIAVFVTQPVLHDSRLTPPQNTALAPPPAPLLTSRSGSPSGSPSRSPSNHSSPSGKLQIRFHSLMCLHHHHNRNMTEPRWSRWHKTSTGSICVFLQLP